MIKDKKYFLKFLLIIFPFLFSCSQDYFRAKKVTNKFQTDSQEQIKNSFTCGQGNYTLIRPKVDILFLWDNSTSTAFINNETKNALARIVDTLSERFDYHIILSPLIGQGNTNSYLIAYDETGLSNSAKNMLIAKNQASIVLNSFPSGDGNQEKGLTRTVEMLSNNISNGIFRQNAYTIITLMSNESDYSYVTGVDNGPARIAYLNEKLNSVLCIRGNYNGNCSGISSINSQMMRFISIVAQNINNSCANSSINQYSIGQIYEQMSSSIYSAPYTNGNPQPHDQDGSTFITRGSESYYLYDSNDICKEDYAGIFDGVNNAIQDTVINHSYNFWPIADGAISLDPNSLLVYRNDGVQIPKLDSNLVINRDFQGKNDSDSYGNLVSGYKYVGITTTNTRYSPNSGEPHSGHMIELFGNAKITYPQCIREVQATSPKEYFGYAHMVYRPLIGSITLKIDGVTISESNVNGWQLLKDQSGNAQYFNNKNIQIVGPNDDTEGAPGLFKSGYFLKLYGNAIYSNDATIDVLYDPQAN